MTGQRLVRPLLCVCDLELLIIYCLDCGVVNESDDVFVTNRAGICFIYNENWIHYFVPDLLINNEPSLIHRFQTIHFLVHRKVNK